MATIAPALSPQTPELQTPELHQVTAADAPSARWYRRWFPTFFVIHRWWAEHLTASGRLLFLLLLLALPGALTEQRYALQVFGGLVATFLVVSWVAWLFRPRLDVKLSMSETVACGQEIEWRVRLANAGRRMCFEIIAELDSRDEDQWEVVSQAMPVVDLAPGEHIDGILTLRPRQRGRWAMPRIRLSTTFPLNLVYRSQVGFSTASVIVTPKYNPFEVAEPVAGGANLLATAPDTVMQRGDSWEYHGSNEYQHGMAVRRWDYGAWARFGRPFVREYEEQTRAHAILLVDTNVDDAVKLEAVVSIAAAITDSLARHHWQIRLLLTQSRPAWTEWESGANTTEQLLEMLSELTASDAGLAALEESAHATSMPLWDMTVFMALSRWDDEVAAACSQWQGRGCEVRATLPSACKDPTPAFVRRVPTPFCELLESVDGGAAR